MEFAQTVLRKPGSNSSYFLGFATYSALIAESLLPRLEFDLDGMIDRVIVVTHNKVMDNQQESNAPQYTPQPQTIGIVWQRFVAVFSFTIIFSVVVFMLAIQVTGKEPGTYESSWWYLLSVLLGSLLPPAFFMVASVLGASITASVGTLFKMKPSRKFIDKEFILLLVLSCGVGALLYYSGQLKDLQGIFFTFALFFGAILYLLISYFSRTRQSS